MRTERAKRMPHQRNGGASQQGFTLMELMSVVVIVGVLSAIAIPTFSTYIYKARASEATEFLGVIRLREEAYRSEFGVYCPTVAGDVSVLDTKSNLVPDPSTTHRDAKPFTQTANWQMLGARPTGEVRFGYGVAAGAPDKAPADFGWNNANADYWFVARAVGDLDGDDSYCTFEIYSPTKNVWIGDSSGNTLAKGWE